jgi:signal transduction histidine kinase/ActR/RegA family two-component response regulator
MMKVKMPDRSHQPMLPAEENVRAEASYDADGMPARVPDMGPLRQPMLDALPIGVGALEVQSGRLLWANEALRTLLAEGLGLHDVVGLLPAEYLPGLEEADWEATVEALRQQTPRSLPPLPHRLQLVHHASRNIAYWEWTVHAVGSAAAPDYLMLTVQSVSEIVLNERLLTSSGRIADRARRRAEALVRLTQLVNASQTTSELLKVVTEEAAAFFDTASAAVLLLRPDGKTLRVGYSIGLHDSEAGKACEMEYENTAASQALTQRITISVTNTALSPYHFPLLQSGLPPAALVSSPIRHDARDYGVVEIYFTQPRDVPDDARTLLDAFAHQTAIALHKADLYEQIAEQRRQLQSIFDNVPVGITYFSPDGRIAALNAAAAQQQDRSVESLLGRRYEEVATGLPVGLFEKVRGGTPFYASHHVVHMPGHSDSVYDVSLLPVRDEAGQVVGLLMLSFDVTALVTARQEADTAREAAENALAEVRATQTQMVQMEKMRAIGELASGVAHDFNNALMAILGYTELAEETLDDPESLAHYLSVIKKASEDASSTVRRLQRFARQRVPAHGEPTDINEVVRDVIDLTRPKWKDAAQKEGRAYKIVQNLGEVPPILTEPSGLREVLINIVQNALYAMPNGGTLTLATRRLNEKQVEIEVGDTGVGMTPEVAARIFDPFFTTRGVEGTGMGLAVSWSIIQRHGGTIDVQSEPGKGTRFFLRLPIEEDVPAPSASQVAAAPQTQRASILVVDDEPIVAGVLTSILSRNGHRVVTVTSAEEALERLRDPSRTFQLVVTDHGMPGMTGLQLVAEIKHTHPNLPVILLTGWGESLLQTHVPEAMPDALLGKPINQNDLLDMVGKALRGEPIGQTPESGQNSASPPPDGTEPAA